MTDILHLFAAGGLIMYPILLASVAAIAIAIERHRYYKQSKTDLALIERELPALLTSADYAAAEALCVKAKGLASEVLREGIGKIRLGLDQRELLEGQASRAAASVRENLNFVSAIVTLSPLLGLLGTVTGMIRSFDVLSVAEGEPFAITEGVAEALIATAFGLFVAILALVIH
ncbi:MotA/TolQ/ExbB proton channel family protein, partial [Sutterella massiliensis]